MAEAAALVLETLGGDTARVARRVSVELTTQAVAELGTRGAQLGGATKSRRSERRAVELVAKEEAGRVRREGGAGGVEDRGSKALAGGCGMPASRLVETMVAVTLWEVGGDYGGHGQWGWPGGAPIEGVEVW